MCLFLETIKIDYGKIPLIDWHQKRINKCQEEHFNSYDKIDLRSITERYITKYKNSVYKLRLIYSRNCLERKIIPYNQKYINKFHVVEADISYKHKYQNRDKLNLLKKNIPDNDDIIIVKSRFITDSSYANLAFYKNGKWYTPSKPLLEGVRRKSLLDKGILREIHVRPESLNEFEYFCQINAMISLEESFKYDIKKINL